MASERGFTFVEVLVVLAVLSVGVLGVLQTTLLAARLESRSEAITAATLLAQSRLERIGALGWDAAVAGLALGPLPAGCGAPGEFPQEAVQSRGLRLLVAYAREPKPADPPLCTVRCYWEGPRGFDARNVVRLAVRRRR